MLKAPASSKFGKYFLIAILMSLTVVIYLFVTNKYQYIPLLGVMFISPFYVLFNIKKFTTYEILLLLVFPLLFLQYFSHPERIRYSTIFYSFLFITLFLSYRFLLKSNSISIKNYIKFIKFILYAYFIVLLIQQLCVILSFPVLNLSWAFEENKWKLNSLSMEPSNTSLIVTILVFSYIYCISIVRNRKYDIIRDFKSDKYIWLSYLYISLTTVSASAFFCIPVLSLYIVRKKNIFLVLVFLSIIILMLNNGVSLFAFKRVTSFMPALLKLDPIALFSLDPSASARILPPIIYVQQFSLNSLETWFGHGNDYGEKYLTNLLLGYLPDEGQGIGGMINFIYDYGLVVFLYFIVIIRKLTIPKFFSYEMLFWILLILVIPFNHYIQWLFWCVCATNTYFSLQHKKKVIDNVSKKKKIKYK